MILKSSGGSVGQISLPITIRNVTKTYGRFKALDDVSIDVASGEFLTLLGPSGSGKTTLLMVLAGFIRPNSGKIVFGDTDVTLAPPHKRDVGMVFQNYALFPHMTVTGNLAYPLKLRRVSRAETEERVRRALDVVQLGGLGDRQVDQLSGGQKQRVALARAIIFEPRILLMDEPLSALDKKLREQMQIEVRHLHQQLGITTVYVTHDQREALTMSDRIAVIDKGRIMQLDTPRRIYEQPSCRFVAEFVGESAFLPVRVAAGVAMLDGTPLKLGEGAEASDGDMFLMVRPEKLRILPSDLSPGEQRPGDDVNILSGRVARFIYQGESFVLDVELSSGTSVSVRSMTSSAAMASLPQTGAPVRLGLDRSDAFLVPAEARAV